jgi:flagellum-specific peptidoglycan hydrolase FlgJ
MAEMGRYGIPASITVAQAILHSNAGDHPLVAKNNNHFGIRCFSKECPKGHCSHHGTEEHKSFYQNFNTAWESFRGHSLLLTKKKYQHLLKLDKNDYKAWANGLQKAGYSKDPQYAQKLIRIIEAMQLAELDV